MTVWATGLPASWNGIVLGAATGHSVFQHTTMAHTGGYEADVGALHIGSGIMPVVDSVRFVNSTFAPIRAFGNANSPLNLTNVTIDGSGQHGIYLTGYACASGCFLTDVTVRNVAGYGMNFDHDQFDGRRCTHRLPSQRSYCWCQRLRDRQYIS